MAETEKKTVRRRKPAAKPVFKVGSQGPEVVQIQQGLRRWGFDIPASGVFDFTTRWAVTRFQQDRGLEATGEVTNLDILDPAQYLG